ncbi:TonB family protein [Hyphomonas sp.]|uniref:TonB family protein n=1 Tax=Hyphomonas sp. TaxID=87 RepID=UPI001DAB40E6|nr:TonB family protein [Hyphomonas sp.]
MLRRILTSSYMAGVALAAAAHGGLLAGVFLLAPAGPSGLGPKDDVFLVTLIEEPVTEQVPEPVPPADEASPVAPEKQDVPEIPVAEVQPAPTSVPEPVETKDEIPVLPVSDSAPEPAMSEQDPGPAFLTLASDTPQQSAEPKPVVEQTASSGAASLSGDGIAMRNAYLRDVRLQLARHAPRGVRGAGNCEVEFRLSRTGEVIFVGIQTSSGSRLYDRRCLKSVTSAVPFPEAPEGAVEADLRFTIVMQQKR